MNRPILSVIIPYYNGENYIENTVKTVLGSNFKDLEVLIIDDGSTEASGSICDKLARKYNKLKVIHKKNGGIADARNRGVHEANGKYITFVDQDDTLEPEMYSFLISILERHECDLVVSDFYMTDGKTGEKKKADFITKNLLLHEEEIKELRKWLVMGEIMPAPKVCIPPNIWNCIISSDMIKENSIRFESFIRYDDDWVFLLRCLAFCRRVFVCKEAFYNWLIHDSSESHTAKYLPQIEEKYMKLKEFKSDYIKNWCKAKDEELEAFNAYFDINTTYVTICNEAVSGNDLSFSRQVIRKVMKDNGLEKFPKPIRQQAIKNLIHKKGNRAGVIYILAKSHLYYAALSACRKNR